MTAPTALGSVIARDRGLLWHPYAPLRGSLPYEVVGAEGPRLHLVGDDGVRRSVVDAMSSWWSVVHGYRHPALDAAARAQLDRFSHAMFGGLTHAPAVELGERLVAMTPSGLEHVFFADSGSVSVEVAMKVALQYQAAANHPERQRFLTIRGGYHGDTFAAMSVCDPVDGMHSAFPGVLARQVFADRPPLARSADEVRGLTRDTSDAVRRWAASVKNVAFQHGSACAAIIVEPVLQGAGGMRPYPADCLRVLREVADEHGMLLVHDEIATGFGRTGTLFGSDWAGEDARPDILCVGKALTGGYMTLAAMLCTGAVAETIERSQFGAVLHGPTFMANPLACTVAAASLDLLIERGWQRDVARLERGLANLHEAQSLSSVDHVRVLGGVGVIQLREPVDVVAVTRAALERGAWVRPFRNLVYTMPPYVSTDDDLRTTCAAMIGAVAEVHG
ncbi:adenosylmethionine--8-amino-7-oxononanoate transaminase [Luteipulveratus halotolerans]|uniref:Adenosylmethionine-8-amino-7-oxononanoate aminotransferase n=1 Tax=Luteipulveratus halotolerans TaxID=1631356 RepID=A0A0L6CLZ8_9MICO|nr:adenosylmethionine--8-amino-7-oxononanoate transaminase [Luteipulveratus halotolerans]KNX38772.1 adenosylmethionine-8-amino-7-oxononanoate aminotransferase [Luteipulveratus halotolerans]